MLRALLYDNIHQSRERILHGIDIITYTWVQAVKW